ncbi:hypothetical protein BU24DRAFT_147131 [Aaosphaeria arxii CBS 175.79]|uniref:DUF7514 domain-containing protein n=1 Tax=Aaosphaeria arxii CBS 175.79 TaxID=1450172 RepID=A0A6A5XWB6_9PLEO|nr:uncharacterized protein BU24DRAFT_147131 [Aaosphaeria arxii CBS 175.79]KAF2017269.1 hypothetical protein BU24DRAFT_147131 [Aaosphaeria arxii CBS 175.79]
MAAYDGYRSQPDYHAPPYGSSYDSNYDSRSYHSAAQFQNPLHHDHPPRPRSRASSNAPSDGQAQPLKNALNNAFDKSDSAQRVDPDLIAQITAEVKKSVLDEIKLSGVGGVTGQPQSTTTLPHHYVPQSPTSTSSSFPPRNVYTPPSPKPHDFSSHGTTSPDPLARDPMFDGAGDTPTPRGATTAPVDIPSERTSRSRPPPVQRMSTDADFTPIEKMWGRLFDPSGQPTPRLGQFLRGLALHLINDYEPKRSLVIPPSKMLKFYSDVKLPDEIYPWPTMFGKLSPTTLCKIYREMRCEHHLIQENLADTPHVPALTPEGFEEWMTVMIQAYPDTEYARLSMAVLDMPISNADDAKERFPKELPRRLFPTQEHLHAQQRCAAILSAENVGPLRRAPTFPPPPPVSNDAGPAPSLERERSPYATQSQPHTRNSSTVQSEEDGREPLAVPIERERKPYSAAPGGGKVYGEDPSRNPNSEASSQDFRRRTQSTASQSQWVPPSNSTYLPQHHARTNSTTTGRRQRSPSFSNHGTRSDPSVREIPGSYYTSNIHDSEEEGRKRRTDWARRQAEEEASAGSAGGHTRRSNTNMSDSSYESQPRSVYDDDYYRDRSASNASGFDSRYDSRRY